MKQLKPFLYILLLMSVITVKAQKAADFTDPRDNKTYKTVKIGKQTWMAENLAYLPKVNPPAECSETEPYYYVYDYEGTDIKEAKTTNNYKTYGVLYNWAAAKTACPVGWHLPSDAEWTELTDYLGGEDVAGGKLKETSTTHWKSPNEGATNESGFTAVPGGCRSYSGAFSGIGRYDSWWSSTEYSSTAAYDRSLHCSSSTLSRYLGSKEIGRSVRCLRDID